MASLTWFNGLQVLAPPGSPEPPGTGGAAINDNFVNLAQRIGACNYTATRDPTTTDNASNTPPYTPGSRWFNTTTNSEWVCIASTTTSATWEKTTTLYSVGSALQATLVGNTRGTVAIDLQLGSGLATQVASGNYSAILGGARNTASGNYSVAFGFANTSSNYGTIAIGYQNSASGYFSVAVGESCSASNYYALAFGLWAHSSARYSIAFTAQATKQGQLAIGNLSIGSPFQRTECSLVRTTTDATQTELTLNGGTPTGTTEPTSNRFIVATGKTYACQIAISARSSIGASAMFLRSLVIKNVSGTISLEAPVQTIGTDVNPSSWGGVMLQADSTNGSLQILVTGATSTTIRWNAVLRANEIYYPP